MSMSEQQVKEFLERAKKRFEKILKSRKESIKFLQDFSIYVDRIPLDKIAKDIREVRNSRGF